MRLTPLDIREQEFKRVMRGLDAEDVQAFLATVAGEFETLVAANNELRQRLVELEEKIAEYRTMEKALRDALLAAEKVMGEAKESAHREAALIVREAEVAAQRTRGRAAQELQQMQVQLGELRRMKDAYVTRMRWLLRSHLELVDGHAQDFAAIDTTLGLPATAPGTEWREAPAAPAAEPPRAGEPPRTAETPHRGEGPRGAETLPPSVSEPIPMRTAPQPLVHGDAVPPPSGPRAEPAGPMSGGISPRSLVPPAWQGEAPLEGPLGGPEPPDLDDVLRPISPDGSYDPATLPSRVPTSEEIAQAARRAERLAAEARATLERHAGAPPPDRSWGADWNRDESSRP